MASSNNEIFYQYPTVIRIYKNGRIERLRDTDFVPAGTDPQTGVSSKDLTDIIPGTEVYIRIYLPNLDNKSEKIPLVVYYHGGGFVASTPASSTYHNYLNLLAAETQVIAASVNYRLAPENSIPIPYDDSMAALQWLLSHSNGDSADEWLNKHADLNRVILAGDSAGANIAHNLAVKIGNFTEYSSKLGQNFIAGIALIHPYFWGSKPIGREVMDPDFKRLQDGVWPIICPSNPNNNDPRLNPEALCGSGLTRLGCKRVLVCVAEEDILRDRGLVYFEVLGRIGYTGALELYETKGENHAFHLYDLKSDTAKELMKKLADFFYQ